MPGERRGGRGLNLSNEPSTEENGFPRWDEITVRRPGDLTVDALTTVTATADC
jgi:hypothetical protein